MKEVETITIGAIQVNNPQYMKFLNKKQVLHYIKDNDGHSRSDIAKALSISKPTISKLVDELLSEGWVTEKESLSSSSSGGRKPFHIYFNSDAQHIIGVDIGGTSVELAIINLDGAIKMKSSFDTQKSLADDLVQTTANQMEELIKKSGLELDQIVGAGIGVPGITDIENGIVIDAPSLSWKQFPLKDKMQDLLPFPVYIDNDVNVAVLGEQWKGAGSHKKNILQITLGTGVGCGLIINGQLYRGASFAAGEIGYMVTDKNRAIQTYDSAFSGYGFLDSHVGGPSITKRMIDHLENENINIDEWSAKKIFQLAKNGDQVALDVVNDALSHLTFALVNVIAIVNPECVILGGGISKSIHSFLPKIVSTIEKHIPVETEVTITKLKDVSLLGAASLFLKEHQSILQK